ncbi:hypothetical protein MBLNU459_g8361t1 [Dothideomycetes sp. NU459]
MHFAWASLALAALASTCIAAPDLDAEQQPLRRPASSSTKHTLTHDLIGLHRNLTSIESISGNELQVGKWLAATLAEQGYATELQEVAKNRYNVLAWPGKHRNARTLVTSHIDTVPPFYPYKIYSNDSETVISGRGSVDAKASVAAQIIATNKLISEERISPDDVTLLYVVGEEVHGDGMRAANALNLSPKTIIFGEPTEGKLASGHKGMLGFYVRAYGKAAHSGYPWLGRSANEVLVKALLALMELGQSLPASEKYGYTTINLGKIEGGVAANVVAETAYAQVAVRIAAGTPEEIKQRIVKAVKDATEEFKQHKDDDDVVELEWASAGYPPVDIDHDVDGFDVFTVNYGTDIPNLDPVKGQKRYLYGPGSILVAHSDHEAITISDLEAAVDGYQKLILHSLRDS